MAKEKIITIENCKREIGLHVTLNHTGKMSGMASLSTSCLANPYCKARAEQGNSVCSHCYSCRQMQMYKNMQKPLEDNAKLLTSRVLSKSEIPLCNREKFRFEAFGDLINWVQVANYFLISKANPKTKFALWTKNPWLIAECIENGYSKPKNLKIVYSSCYLNKEESEMLEKYPFLDRIFTVFTKDYIAENNVNINCGARNCFACGLCYGNSKAKFVREVLK